MNHSPMYSLLKSGYDMIPKFYTDAEIKFAVTLNWITQDECNEILNLTEQIKDVTSGGKGDGGEL